MPKLRAMGDKPKSTLTPVPRKKTEKLTPIEKKWLSKMFQAYLKQYPEVSKGKRPGKYAFNYAMATLLEEKMIRMKLLDKRDES